MANPEPTDSIQMQGYPFRRVDIGEYRIVYRIEDDCLNVACVGKRNDDEVYRILKRKLKT
jgi:mRNA interferase RelE/StbE